VNFKIKMRFLSGFIMLIHGIEFPTEFISLIMQTILLVFIILSYILTRKLSRRGVKVQSTLSDFSTKIKMINDKIELPEYTTVAKGTMTYTKTVSPIGAVYSNVKWRSKEIASVLNISLKDLCIQPPTIVKLGSTMSVIMPAVKILEGVYKDIVISCLNTENLHVNRWLEVVYNEGFARSFLNIGGGRIKTRLEWVHYMVESTTGKVKAQAEICYGKKPCMPLIEISKPGAMEKLMNYPVVKKIFIGYINGGDFEGLEELVKEFPSIFGVENVNIKLRVQRSLRVIAESSTPLIAF